jgi:hypothetical protein
MRLALADMLSLLCAVAGWFYLFYSKAAHRLENVESQRDNTRRVILRRICGAFMFALGGVLFAATNSLDADLNPRGFLLAWLAIFLLLGLIVLLTLIDLRMTARLHQRLRDGSGRP